MTVGRNTSNTHLNACVCNDTFKQKILHYLPLKDYRTYCIIYETVNKGKK